MGKSKRSKRSNRATAAGKKVNKTKRRPRDVAPEAFDEMQHNAERQVMDGIRESPQFKEQVAEAKGELEKLQRNVRKKVLKGMAGSKPARKKSK